MKIVDRKKFLTFPAETLYCKYSSMGNFGSLCIKHCEPGYWENDFISVPLMEWIKNCETTSEFFDLMKSAEDSGTDIQFDLDTELRDGEYNIDELFCVYNKSDIKELVFRLIKLI